ncbi:MAG: AI-2E family transporter, partial [Candidatus Hydrothermarchaeaceae archaeon]
MKKDIEWATLALLLFILFVAALYVIKPFIDAVIVAAFFAYITAPLTNRLERILKSRSISAALVVLLAILPLILLGWQTMKIYSNEFSKLSDIKIYTPILQNIDWTGIYSSILSEISNRISPEKVIQGIGIGLELFLKFFIVLVGSFYLLRERVALRAF